MHRFARCARPEPSRSPLTARSAVQFSRPTRSEALRAALRAAPPASLTFLSLPPQDTVGEYANKFGGALLTAADKAAAEAPGLKDKLQKLVDDIKS